MEQLVAQGVSEGPTLEFKGEPYRRNDDGRKELAKDVAAFANASGGLVIIGLTEDEAGRANGVPKVALLDDERNRMRLVLSSSVAPLIPDLQIGELRDPDEPGTGVFLILVPASGAAPHGVQYNQRFYWPVREDRTTRPMHEPELASRYRERFDGADRQSARLNTVNTEGLERLLQPEGWLAMSLVPAKLGRLTADRESYRGWLRSFFETRPWGIAVDSGLALGRRRVIFTDQYQFQGESHDHHLELHSDGSGFAAIALTSREQSPADAARLDHPEGTQYFHVDKVAVWSFVFLEVLAAHAVRTGAGGDLAIRAQLVAAEPDPVGLANEAGTLAVLENVRDIGMARVVPGSRLLSRTTSLDGTVPASIVLSSSDLVAAAADVAQELVVEFGAEPTRPLLRTDGRVNDMPSWPASTLRQWAASHDLLASDV
ncbi:AlbA family DNA-binding domain-containing protein [Kribbella sp. CA-245084]|uniref:AlbA family DNA-binding domain-containing protein n=1 Tax=Kribbella sp. CA-245084 TaxID=3239940 RepID=UPI003D930DCC